MSKSIWLKQGRLIAPGTRETSKGKTSRREFIHSAAGGAVDASIVVADPANIFTLQTDRHGDDFLARARRVRVTPEVKRELERAASLILYVVNKDREAQVGFEKSKTWLVKLIGSPSLGERRTELGFTEDESAVIAVTYLRALSELRANDDRLSFDSIKKHLANFTRLLDGLEPNFISSLFSKTKVERRRSSSFANKVDAAMEDFAETALRLTKEKAIGSREDAFDPRCSQEVDRSANGVLQQAAMYTINIEQSRFSLLSVVASGAPRSLPDSFIEFLAICAGIILLGVGQKNAEEERERKT